MKIIDGGTFCVAQNRTDHGRKFINFVRGLASRQVASIRRKSSRSEDLESPIEQILSPLREPFKGTLLSMYRNEPQLGADGQHHALDTTIRVTPTHGMWLYKLVRDHKPKHTLEVGLGYGFSTIFFLAANCDNGHGAHVAIDAYQDRFFSGVGKMRPHVLGLNGSHFRLFEEESAFCLPRLVAEKKEFGVIFIDGNHKFDDVLLDFSHASRICSAGGIVVLDDMWMPSIQSVASFIRKNRTDFEEIPAPEGTSTVAFKKVAPDTRRWDHFVSF
jgi:predicted O-methyltransferase YrrM